MFAHIFRVGESDQDGLHQHTTSVRILEKRDAQRHFQYDEPCLVLGTLPHTTSIRMSQIRRIWIEED